jgi:hypothetical protein
VQSIKATTARREAERIAQTRRLAETWLAEQVMQHSQFRDAALVVLPGKESRLVPLADLKRDAFLAHINELVSRPPAERMEAAQPLDAPMPALAAACATCRGYCCRYGGNRAFIDADTIERVRALHSGIENEEIAGLYSAAIPTRHVVDSCVFHGFQGCTLPRELRADVCNQYYCKPLKEWVAASAGHEHRPTAIAVVLEKQVVRGTLTVLSDIDRGDVKFSGATTYEMERSAPSADQATPN